MQYFQIIKCAKIANQNKNIVEDKEAIEIIKEGKIKEAIESSKAVKKR